MNRIPFGQTGLQVSEVAIGCMRIARMEPDALDGFVRTAMEREINFFDHADIYGRGACEEVFAASVARLGIPREAMFIQSKCGIRPGFFDFSRAHILASVDAILKRLNSPYLDCLLLHRPDALMEPAEIAEAFGELHAAGKVRHFGVSNFNPGQIELLQASCPLPLHANQLQLSLMHTGMIDRGLTVNMRHDNSLDRDGGVLDYCRLKGITVQAWSPFQYGFFKGVFMDSPKFPKLNAVMDRMCDKYGMTKTGLAIAWIQRHPAQIQSVLGTTNAGRVNEVADACTKRLEREDWYELYRAAGNILP